MLSLKKLIKYRLPLSLVALLGICGLALNGRLTTSKALDSKTDKIRLQDGFRAEHLFSPSDNKMGSWVSMAFDDKGRMITSDQYGFLYRLELPPIGSTAAPKVEKLTIGDDTTKVNMGFAHGLLYAFNSLYVVASNENLPQGSGLYRLQDTNGDDKFDKMTLLKHLKGEGEHGPHSIVLSPDKQSIYLVAGNFTDLPKMDSYLLMPNWKNDNLFPWIKDPRGHATDRNAPGGWIARTDSEGKKWELVSAGFRNSYDIAFNEAGDLFIYDSDMEWDFGTPWYRPTRVCHATSGAEYGWRTGSINGHPANADNLPPIMNIGQGSPTNLIYLKDARFPAKYKNTLLAFDWSFGIVHGLHLKPNGSTYSADHEEFLSGAPLPLTDGLIGPDGALYFLTGGRRLGSDLYRVYHKDYKDIPAGSNVVKAPVITAEHKSRTDLEKFHAKKDPKAVETSWPYLKSPDRFLRYAARLAIEHQPVAEWEAKVYAEKDPQTLIYASLALSRQGDSTKIAPQLIKNLTAINYNQLTTIQKQDLLRTIEVLLYRTGVPEAASKAKLTAYLNAIYPSPVALHNRYLSKILVYLEAPQVIEKTLALIKKNEVFDDKDNETATASADLIMRNPQYGLDIAKMLEKLPPAQQTYYAIALSTKKNGWTPVQREEYFKWYKKAFGFQGGNSYIGFIDKARQNALKNVPKDKLAYYDKLSGGDLLSSSGNDIVNTSYSPKGPGRGWKVDEAEAIVKDSLNNRDFAKGKLIFSAVMCSRCHTIQGQGSDAGPDLTQLGTRFSTKDILEAIIQPNAAISDQYAATVFVLKDGQTIVGRLANEDGTSYHVSQNPFDTKTVIKIPKKNVVSKKYSTVSVMLPGLINGLNPEELKDLVAYLVAGGNQNHSLYTGKK